MSGLFARHKGRHRHRRGLFGLNPSAPQPAVDDFSRSRTPALAPAPTADDELIPFAGYRHPYETPKDSAA